MNRYRAPAPKRYDTAFVFGDDVEEQVQAARAALPRGGGLRGPGRSRGARSRKAYQETRVVANRQRQGALSDTQLTEDLRKKLFSGIKDSQTAADRVEAINTLKAITICITTRSMGFGVVNFYHALFEFDAIPVRGDIYQMYRVSLAVIEAKVKMVQRGVGALLEHEDDYQRLAISSDIFDTARTVTCLPDQLSCAINAIGKLKMSDRIYIPKIGKKQYSKDALQQRLFVPQSEQIIFSNLRETVEALASLQTPSRYRQRFLDNCPIPGAIWRDSEDNGPILLNGDEIMPPLYNDTSLLDDIGDIQNKINFLAKRGPKNFSKAVSFEVEGAKAMLVCNDQSGMHINRRLENESLDDYVRRMKIIGNVTEYSNLERLTTGEQVDGVLSLLGERPTSDTLTYPVYAGRDARVCVEMSSLKYKAAKQLKYT